MSDIARRHLIGLLTLLTTAAVSLAAWAADAAAELAKLQVDVIYAVTSPAAFAAKAATRTIPMVAWAAHGAVETGLVPSLTRPAVVYETGDQGSPLHLKSIRAAEKELGLTLTTLAVQHPEDFEPVFAAAAGKPQGAVLTLTSNMIFFNGPRIRDFAQANRLPTCRSSSRRASSWSSTSRPPRRLASCRRSCCCAPMR